MVTMVVRSAHDEFCSRVLQYNTTQAKVLLQTSALQRALVALDSAYPSLRLHGSLPGRQHMPIHGRYAYAWPLRVHMAVAH